MITRNELQRLNDDCMKLCNYTDRLESSYTKELSDYNRVIRQVLRKFIIANEVSNKMIICITGLQGSGKTTLIKNFFDLDESVMNISIGRGERLPILISEDSSVESLQLWEIGLEKKATGYDTFENRVSKEDFIKLSKAEDEDSVTMYLEIRMPKGSWNVSGVSFMLLPGYEGKDNYWETLIDFSVKCSDTAICVLQPSDISSDNDELMGSIKNKFGDNVVYAITYSDVAEDENSEIKTTLGGILEFEEEQSDRIICTGSFLDKQKNKEWRSQLKTAIENYAAHPESKDSKITEYLGDIIINDLRPAVGEIKTLVNDKTDEVLREFKHSSWLAEFDKAVKRMRKEYEKNLDREFKKAKREDCNKLEKEFDEIPQIKKIARVVFGDNLKYSRKLEEIIDKSMKENKSNAYEYHFEEAFSKAVRKCTYDICGKLLEKETPLISRKTSSLIQWNQKDDEEIQQIFQDVKTILSNDRTELVAKNTKEIMSAIVELGTQYFGLVSVNELSLNGTEISGYERTEIEVESKEYLKSTKKFVKGVLGVAGLDILENGVMDFVPKLAESVKLPIEVVAGGVAGVTLLGTLKNIIKDYNYTQMKDFYSCERAIDDIYENIKTDYLGYYDACMERLSERVGQFLIDSIGANEVAVDKQNALISINNISKDIDKIGRELNEVRYDITKNIKG